MRILDLEKLSTSENQLLNEVAFEIRRDFNKLVEMAGQKYEQNIDWIVSSIASRNKYLSPLFLRCCYLVLIRKLVDRDQNIDEVVLNDLPLAKVLKKFFEDKKIPINVRCNEKRIHLLKRIFRPIYDFGNACILLSLRFLSRSRKTREGLLSIYSPITLLDTFVIQSQIGEGGSIYKRNYKDRYYPGVLENLSDKDKKSIFYYPTLIGFKNPITAFRLIRDASDQFIIPDDFLKFSDYLFILVYPLRVFRLKISRTVFMGFDITAMLQQEKIFTCCNIASFTALLNYRFAFRAAQERLRIKLLIDWNENQVIDRGLIVGFRRFHPNTSITGYQGYIISRNLHLYIYPTTSELRSLAVPHRIGVIGRGLLKDVQEFCNGFEAIVAPAFRFRNVWDKRKQEPESSVYTILVALPIGLEGSENILKLIVSGIGNFEGSDFRFWIKPHPTYSPDQIRVLLKAWPENFHFRSGNFNECVEGANLLIGNASSTCLEAMTKGVPVIIIGESSGIIENPIPENVSTIMWKLCITKEDLISAIWFFRTQYKVIYKEYRDIGVKIRENYFEPVTKEGINSFLELDLP